MNAEHFNQELIDTILNEDVTQELHTIQDFLRWGYSLFNRAEMYFGHGYDNGWEESQHLVLGALQLPLDFPQKLYNSRLTKWEKEQVLQLFMQRIQYRIPAAYLTNSAWFCGLEFYVDDRVIIPRSPISALIQERFSHLLRKEPKHILDMCTGSGCIAIACAKEFPKAEVDAVDISIDALNVAEINIERHQVSHRVFPIQSNLFEQVPPIKYDLIVSNPPYVDAEDLADMPQEYHCEPEISLGSGIDGLEITRKILASAADYLTEDGVLVCEVGNSMIHLIELFPEVPFQWVQLKNGGLGVFALTKQDLAEHQASFLAK